MPKLTKKLQPINMLHKKSSKNNILLKKDSKHNININKNDKIENVVEFSNKTSKESICNELLSNIIRRWIYTILY